MTSDNVTDQLEKSPNELCTNQRTTSEELLVWVTKAAVRQWYSDGTESRLSTNTYMTGSAEDDQRAGQFMM